MGNIKPSQLELFNQQESYNTPETRNQKSALSYVRVYQKTILLIIGFIITGLVSFSLGVEKGMRNAKMQYSPLTQKEQIQVPLTRTKNIVTHPAITKEVTTVPVRTEEVTTTPMPVKPADSIKSYTIQLASYQSKEYAQKAAAALKKNGLSPLIISKGGYTVLCVGNFSNKDTANSLLSELKKQYKDCFVRRL